MADHVRRLDRRQPARSLIDRDAQALPVPLGSGSTPVRVARRQRRRILRAHRPAVATIVGCLCAATGGVLLVAPSPQSAYLSGDHVHIGAMTLADVGRMGPAGAVLYGGDASYTLSESGKGTARAAAAWTKDGVVHTATCNLRSDSLRLIAECTFDAGSSELTSLDVLDIRDGSTWRRTYGDGRQVDIAVPPDGAAVPVPFPIGH
ncbi:MAG: hypothetical protein ABI352_09145 [Candidatus Dormibacter sp.]